MTTYQDPYRNFKFRVEITGFIRAGFAKISGLEETTEDIEYREGGENETPHHLTGQTKFGDITMERGISRDEDFVNWRQLIFDANQVEGFQPPNDDYRKVVVIYLRDKAGNDVKQWTVQGCWPKSLKHGDLDANGNEVDIETIVLANEGWTYTKLD